MFWNCLEHFRSKEAS